MKFSVAVRILAPEGGGGADVEVEGVGAEAEKAGCVGVECEGWDGEAIVEGRPMRRRSRARGTSI